MIKRLWVIASLFLLLSGCLQLDAGVVDKTDPVQVVAAWLKSIRTGEYSIAIALTIPKDRKMIGGRKFRKELSRLPPIPASPEIEIDQTRRNSETRLKARIPNWHKKIGLELIFQDGKWWIEK